MKRTFVFVIVASFFVTLYAQSPAKYWVQFKDKANTTYSIDRPQEFLSLRAIEKRQRFNIDITEQDFPVNESYIRQVLALDENMVLLTKSKWLNGITVYSTVKDIDKQIRELKCVAMCECTASLENEETFDYPQSTYTPPKTTKEVFVADEHVGNFSYGKTSVQLAMNQAHWLHRLGARGEGMLMVVMDGGFKNANKMECFEALRQEGRLLGTRNFVQPGRSVFISGSHGSEVLSCITGYVDNEFMGTAPKASFYLAMTEDSRSENKIEEDNWVAGVEWADSLGCDVLNSSLGYYKFDNKLQSYQYEEMNGKISRASQAATLAAQKGMIICVSAGNEGDEEWHYITAPADAEGVLTVGAIDREGSMAEFSSYGPTADGRVKPDAIAVGSRVMVITPEDEIEASYGTSFSSPVLSGMVACLWQLFPEKSVEDVIDAVQRAGNLHGNPQPQAGYGVPNFMSAYNNLARDYDAPVLIVFDNSTNKPVVNCAYLCNRGISTIKLEMRIDGDPNVYVKEVKVKGQSLEDGHIFGTTKVKLPKFNINAYDSGYSFVRVKVISPDGTSYSQVIGLY